VLNKILTMFRHNAAMAAETLRKALDVGFGTSAAHLGQLDGLPYRADRG
jgi:hypothetical protein